MKYHPQKYPHIPFSEVTPEHVFDSRRQFLKKTAVLAAAAPVVGLLPFNAQAEMNFIKSEVYKSSGTLTVTGEEYTTSYTNFYEFGTEKEKPASVFANFKTSPWSVVCGGLVENPMTLDAEELSTMFALEERVYRLRCVEAWSAVIPWVGFPLNKLLQKLKPKSNAKYVKFTTFLDPEVAPGQRSLSSYPWPYTEGLRLDEAMNNLSLLTFGMYGKPLSKANGAPIRMVIPWKYGFKSIKSINRIELTDNEPSTTWNLLAPNEYGFYANVNPEVDHPRWSQSSERALGSIVQSLFARKQTLMFNGYQNEVMDLYSGMDLRKNY